jgi:hypothetical protein
MGNDFSYQNAEWIFVSLDKIVKHTQSLYPNIEVIYSTPSKYFESLKDQMDLFGVYTTADLLPYADDYKSYWTGFYTSRPNFKETVREASRSYQAANHHLTLAALNPDSLLNVDVYRQRIADAIAMS